MGNFSGDRGRTSCELNDSALMDVGEMMISLYLRSRWPIGQDTDMYWVHTCTIYWTTSRLRSYLNFTIPSFEPFFPVSSLSTFRDYWPAGCRCCTFLQRHDNANPCPCDPPCRYSRSSPRQLHFKFLLARHYLRVHANHND